MCHANMLLNSCAAVLCYNNNNSKTGTVNFETDRLFFYFKREQAVYAIMGLFK